MIQTRAKKTLADYMAMPESVRGELLEGEFFMSPSPGSKHQITVGNVFARLDAHVRARKLGRVYVAPFDCILSDEDVVQPDVLFVAAANLGKIRDRLYGAPDLAVEVLSPENAVRDRIVKRDLYARFGVREYWIVDPDARTVEVMGRGVYGAGDAVTTSLLPGLQLPVAELFE